MPESTPTLAQYVRSVRRHGVDAFSLYSWAIAAIFFIWTVANAVDHRVPGPGILVGTILTGLAAFTAVLSGTFGAWKEQVLLRLRNTDFGVGFRSVAFDIGSHRADFPAGPEVFFNIELDCRNNSSGLILLHQPTMTVFDLSSAPFDNAPLTIAYALLNPPHGSQSISFPLAVEAGKRPRLGVQVSVRHRFRDEEFLAAHLRDFGAYHIVLSYVYEDMTQTRKEGLVNVSGDLKGYATRLAESWRDRHVHQLVEIVRTHSPEFV